MSAARRFPTRTARRCAKDGEGREKGANITHHTHHRSAREPTSGVDGGHTSISGSSRFFLDCDSSKTPLEPTRKTGSPLVAAISGLDRPDGLVEAIPVKVVFPNQGPLARNNTERDEEEP